MKYVAYTVLGLALLVLISWALLAVNMPTARLRIHPISPSGEIWRWKGYFGLEEPWPIWRFGITNEGRAVGSWNAKVLYRGPHGFILDFIPSQQWSAAGTLKPGEGLITNMPVPSEPDFVWAGCIEYQSSPGKLETSLSSYRNRFPKLFNLLPSAGPNQYYDEWRSTTNFRAVSAPRGLGTNQGVRFSASWPVFPWTGGH